MLDSIDKTLFVFINQSLANPVTDFVMPIITNDNLLRIMYGLAMVLLLIFGTKRLRWMVLFSAIALALADQTAAGLLKPIFERMRPCHVLENVNLLVHCGGGYAMPSAHSSSAFAQAIFFGMLIPRSRWYLILFALMIALSRVFVGVHYPFDITVGALLGSLIAYILVIVFRQCENRFGWSESSTAGVRRD